jgi:hypothetical protein
LLLIGYFEGLDAERAIAWRAADSFALREFLGLILPDAPPDHSTISRRLMSVDHRGQISAIPGSFPPSSPRSGQRRSGATIVRSRLR